MYAERTDEVIDALNDGSVLYSIKDKQYLDDHKPWAEGKIDLVIWAKNGSRTLDCVLKRINKAIPSKIVNQRILVNDHSVDDTVSIGKSNGWKVLLNNGVGISDAANTALEAITSDWFASFEQDVLLSSNWWLKISNMVSKNNVAALSGVRFLPQSHLCYGIEYYNNIKQDGYGKTLDNTLWNTEKLKQVGGFPKLSCAGLDTYLANTFKVKGYQWLVNHDVQSLHLHNGLMDELKRYTFYGESLQQLYSVINDSNYDSEVLGTFIWKLCKSPLSSLIMIKATHDPRLFFSYPAVRLGWLIGYIRGGSI